MINDIDSRACLWTYERLMDKTVLWGGDTMTTNLTILRGADVGPNPAKGDGSNGKPPKPDAAELN